MKGVRHLTPFWDSRVWRNSALWSLCVAVNVTIVRLRQHQLHALNFIKRVSPTVSKIKSMGLFSSKPASSLPPEVLASVHTMQDDLDGKAPSSQKSTGSVLPGTENASPFVFSASPAMKNMTPVNENGLTSPITITKTDSSEAIPDSKDSSPFLSSNPDQTASAVESPTASLESKPAAPLFSQEKPVRNPSFVSENVTLGADQPSYFLEQDVHKKKGIFIVGVILLLLALLAGGVFAYLSFFAKKTDVPLPAVEMPIQEVTEIAPVSETPVDGSSTGPFTFSSPNYLSIDVETVTTEQLRTILLEKQALLDGSGVTDTVVEFFITDRGNNPIAFVRFATLMGIPLPQAVMSELDESFSLYLYNDNHTPRIGFALSMKNKDALKSVVKKDESAIAFALQSVYFDPSVKQITAGTFKDGSYKTYETRYFNIGSSGLSNDYTFTEKHWVIGTSQSAFRKILDIFGTAL